MLKTGTTVDMLHLPVYIILYANFNNSDKIVESEHKEQFLDASTHLYKRVCPSVGPSVGPLHVFFQ